MKTQILSKSLIILLIFVSLLSCRKKPQDPSVVRSSKYRESLKDVYEKVGLFYHANMIPGMAVAVSIDNKLVWADGFGFSNYELKAKASPTHKFRIGQVSELITALTVAKLNEEEKLKIDKTVAELFPQLSKKPAVYTIRQLGAHAAGIRTENTPAGKGNTTSIETIIPEFINDDLLYEPGTNLMHTELGFDMIGYLIEKSTKEAFYRVVKKNVLDTLHLEGTVPDVPSRIIDNRSSNYDFNFVAQPIVASPIDLRGKEASAGYLSSVLDLVKMGNLLLYPGFLKQESIDLLTKPFKLKGGQDSQYSFGLISTKDIQGHTFYGIRGAVEGGSASLLIYPDDKMVIAVAANVQNSSWELPVFEIAESFMKQLHPELFLEKKKEQETSEAK
ncbi:MAG: beta-lactamase family protein [Prolixibacteraceae bacterium]|nr:beta-lactamase family protein [Prolixibacteraceae bacterium]